ncbi:MAG TPA: SDR family NAD(P)-dependent oxidoreductase, partial [Chloroflexota bacterium]|nr:SDR family NAD(P)-dependent oxidoreductase [Chloroflexota bacterium]
MTGRLDGAVALVTGAGRGLGRAIALAYGQEGAQVALTARTREDLEAVAAEIGAEATLVYPGDVRDAGTATALVAAVIERFGRLDVLVNNAGSGMAQPTEQMELVEWQRIIETNLTGPFLMTQAAGRVMLGQGSGRIIN